jgi:hypothetical protein
MNPISVAAVSAACIFAGALLGMGLQRLLPEQHLGSRTQDVVKLSAGMIGTLTALVLGLLVSSAKTSFDTMSNGIVQSSAKIILLDRALARYGPESKGAREQMKRAVAATIEVAWPAHATGVSTLTGVERSKGMELVQDQLSQLAPQNDAQRTALAQAQQIMGDLAQTRWLLIEQSHNDLPLPLLLILIFWLVLLFVSFGLFAPPNATALTVLFLGACAVSAAILLVLELNRPLEGLITVSSGPLQNALRHLND